MFLCLQNHACSRANFSMWGLDGVGWANKILIQVTLQTHVMLHQTPEMPLVRATDSLKCALNTKKNDCYPIWEQMDTNGAPLYPKLTYKN